MITKMFLGKRLFFIMALTFLAFVVIPDRFSNAEEKQAPKSLFEGKRITVDVANAAGGGNDAVARIVASFIPKYTGAKVTVTNTPAGGGVQAANMLSKTDPSKEPYTICLMGSGPILPQLQKMRGVVYDFKKFTWVGMVADLGVVLFTGAKSPYKNVVDLLNAKEFKEASVGAGSIGHIQAKLRKLALGWNSTLVAGYKRSTDIILAAQQNEIDLASLAYTGVKNAVDDGRLRILASSGPVPAEVRAKTPSLLEMPEIASRLNDDQKQIVDFLEHMALGRSFAAPPGTPEEVKAEWEKVLKLITGDPEFIGKMEKMGYVVTFHDSAWMQQRINTIVDGLMKYKDMVK
jgi:tripartite-type tricarboxylate transporter receptor subunit TctC